MERSLSNTFHKKWQQIYIGQDPDLEVNFDVLQSQVGSGSGQKSAVK
jgi:hypothetical protein